MKCLVFALLLIPFFIEPVFAQQIVNVTQTEPCFLNYSAGLNILRNCGASEDYIQFSLLGWEWITGGNFSLVLVSLFSLMTYIKYHKAVYPILIGVLFLPISYFVFPETFLSFAFIMAFMAVGLIIAYIYLKQTKEY